MVLKSRIYYFYIPLFLFFYIFKSNKDICLSDLSKSHFSLRCNINLCSSFNEVHLFIRSFSLYINFSFIDIKSVFFKGCVCYIFFSLLCMSKREYLWNREKCFLFHFKISFHSWDNQSLTFQVFKCHDIIKCLSMKHKTHLAE